MSCEGNGGWFGCRERQGDWGFLCLGVKKYEKNKEPHDLYAPVSGYAREGFGFVWFGFSSGIISRLARGKAHDRQRVEGPSDESCSRGNIFFANSLFRGSSASCPSERGSTNFLFCPSERGSSRWGKTNFRPAEDVDANAAKLLEANAAPAEDVDANAAPAEDVDANAAKLLIALRTHSDLHPVEGSHDLSHYLQAEPMCSVVGDLHINEGKVAISYNRAVYFFSTVSS